MLCHFSYFIHCFVDSPPRFIVVSVLVTAGCAIAKYASTVEPEKKVRSGPLGTYPKMRLART